MAVKGLTAAERAADRVVKKRQGRRKYFADEAKAARNGRECVQHACRFAFAVAENELDDEGRRELARRLAQTTDQVSMERRGDGP